MEAAERRPWRSAAAARRRALGATRPPRPSGPAALAALAATVVVGARAQIYQFNKEPLPPEKTLHTLHSFFVYSHADAPDRGAGHPFVKFHGLQAHSTDPGKPDASLQGYESVQLSILPYGEFWELIDPKKFCALQDDVAAGLADRADQLLIKKGPADQPRDAYTHAVRFNIAEKDTQLPVRATGVYILVYSNCGNFTSAIVSGSVIVKNAYGFLPGNDYHKLPFYGWLLLAYMSMAILWMFLSFRWWRELFHIQYCIAVVIFLGLLEAFFWWIFFNDWNGSGLRSTILFVIAIFCSVIKSVFSFMLVLVAALGWGVTRPYLDQRTIMKLTASSVVYIILDFIRQSVLSFRHSHSLPLPFKLFCLLPVALMNGAIFYWIFTALSSLMETLRERKQHEKLLLFERLWKILIAALALGSFTMLFQIFDLSHSISIRWHYQWFFADGISHLLFLAVLACMMYLWGPHMNSQRFAYSSVDGKDKPVDKDGEAAKAEIWADEEGFDDGDDDTFWATTHKAPGEPGSRKTAVAAAETIGAASALES